MQEANGSIGAVMRRLERCGTGFPTPGLKLPRLSPESPGPGAQLPISGVESPQLWSGAPQYDPLIGTPPARSALPSPGDEGYNGQKHRSSRSKAQDRS